MSLRAFAPVSLIASSKPVRIETIFSTRSALRSWQATCRRCTISRAVDSRSLRTGAGSPSSYTRVRAACVMRTIDWLVRTVKYMPSSASHPWSTTSRCSLARSR
jgi:hypothetical protein